jgi:ribosome-associated protein
LVAPWYARVNDGYRRQGEVALTTKKTPEDKKPNKSSQGGGKAARPAAKRAKAAARPKIRASHTAVADAPKATSKRRASAGSALGARKLASGAAKAGRAAPLRKTALAGPKRAVKRVAAPESSPPEPSSQAREFAIALAAAGIDKKALGIEILDVTGKVDYADFLVVMTGRSDRHVHAIATGLEEAMRRKKVAPLSMEGLSAATWVLIDFGDVVVHVFQEEARLLYDIEGLWIDAGRVPVPADGPPPGAPVRPPEVQ